MSRGSVSRTCDSVRGTYLPGCCFEPLTPNSELEVSSFHSLKGGSGVLTSLV